LIIIKCSINAYLFEPDFVGKELVQYFGRVRVAGVLFPVLYYLGCHRKHAVLLMLKLVVQLTQARTFSANGEILKWKIYLVFVQTKEDFI
jgi:hypothetical protein